MANSVCLAKILTHVHAATNDGQNETSAPARAAAAEAEFCRRIP
jgi:hypothetical protein